MQILDYPICNVQSLIISLLTNDLQLSEEDGKIQVAEKALSTVRLWRHKGEHGMNREKQFIIDFLLKQ